MGRFVNLKGQKFGMLESIGLYPQKTSIGGMQWKCVCDCGNKAIVASCHLVSGHTKSCGCLLKEVRKEHFKASHRKSESRVYSIYSNMKNRCCNPSSKRFYLYGGRGIKVCDRWLNSFENFYEDMGDPPGGYEIERKDVNGNYEPNNCEWVTHAQQARNTRSNVRVTLFGKETCLAETCESLSVNTKMVYERRRNGWCASCAIFIPSLLKKSDGEKKNISDFARHKCELNKLKH